MHCIMRKRLHVVGLSSYSQIETAIFLLMWWAHLLNFTIKFTVFISNLLLNGIFHVAFGGETKKPNKKQWFLPNFQLLTL